MTEVVFYAIMNGVIIYVIPMNPFETAAMGGKRTGAKPEAPKPERERGPIDVEKAREIAETLKALALDYDRFVGELEGYDKKKEKTWIDTAVLLYKGGSLAWPHLKKGVETLEKIFGEQNQNPDTRKPAERAS